MREVGHYFGKSTWAINDTMRRKHIPRRLASATRNYQFIHSPLSFQPKQNLTTDDQLLKVAGLMLYWGEGGKTHTSGIDFANSDPSMIKVFLKFLRTIYQIDESRIRIYLYSYQTLPTNKLIEYWSNQTKISSTQFTKPYIRSKSKEIHDKMQHGLIHIRYSDIRLFRIVMNEIAKVNYSWGTQVDNEGGL